MFESRAIYSDVELCGLESKPVQKTCKARLMLCGLLVKLMHVSYRSDSIFLKILECTLVLCTSNIQFHSSCKQSRIDLLDVTIFNFVKMGAKVVTENE